MCKPWNAKFVVNIFQRRMWDMVIRAEMST